jgi:hypothetical protein
MSLTNAGIDGGRLLADLYRLREFGTYLTGVHRPTLSAVDMQARHATPGSSPRSMASATSSAAAGGRGRACCWGVTSSRKIMPAGWMARWA